MDELATTSPQGGVGGASLDVKLGKDRALLRRAVSREWGVKPGDLARYKAGLDEALEIAMQERDSRQIDSCVRTMSVIVSQMQADEHLEAKLLSELRKPGTTVNVGVQFKVVKGDCWEGA